MQLDTIKISNYKNISEAKLELSEKINCLVGNNGTGKTNFLDTIYYLTFTRSYFNHIDNQNIKYDESFFRLEGIFKKNDLKSGVVATFSSEKGKTISLNEKKHKKFSDHLGLFPAVMITPYDVDLIIGGSEIRRNFVDSIISQFDKEYLNLLINYKKALLQRNKLLKSFAEKRFFDKDLLEIWDYKIIEISPIVYKKRLDFINNFIETFANYYKKISETNEIASIIYKSELNDFKIDKILTENLQKDLALQRTTSGIHRDDLIFKLNDNLLKKTASQGQQKTFVTALKFAQCSFINTQTDIKPILLLDDIFDKLDTNRVQNVVNLVSDSHFGQIFITHTDKDKLETILKPSNVSHSIIEVCDGNFKQI